MHIIHLYLQTPAQCKTFRVHELTYISSLKRKIVSLNCVVSLINMQIASSHPVAPWQLNRQQPCWLWLLQGLYSECYLHTVKYASQKVCFILEHKNSSGNKGLAAYTANGQCRTSWVSLFESWIGSLLCWCELQVVPQLQLSWVAVSI